METYFCWTTLVVLELLEVIRRLFFFNLATLDSTAAPDSLRDRQLRPFYVYTESTEVASRARPFDRALYSQILLYENLILHARPKCTFASGWQNMPVLIIRIAD